MSTFPMSPTAGISNSLFNCPVDPPSSLTATIAVTSMGNSFNPESKHEIPVPYTIIISRCKEKSNF